MVPEDYEYPVDRVSCIFMDILSLSRSPVVGCCSFLHVENFFVFVYGDLNLIVALSKVKHGM